MTKKEKKHKFETITIPERTIVVKHKFSSFKKAYENHMVKMPKKLKGQQVMIYIDKFFERENLEKCLVFNIEEYSPKYIATLKIRLMNSKYHLFNTKRHG